MPLAINKPHLDTLNVALFVVILSYVFLNSSLNVKVILARTMPTVFLTMNLIPITVTVSWDSVEQTVNMEV